MALLVSVSQQDHEVRGDPGRVSFQACHIEIPISFQSGAQVNSAHGHPTSFYRYQYGKP